MYNTELFASLWAFLASFGIFITLIVVFTIIVRWKMFTKAGKPGWASIVPVYSNIVLLDIIGYNWYYIFVGCLTIVPAVGSLAVLLFEISKNTVMIMRSPFGFLNTFDFASACTS